MPKIRPDIKMWFDYPDDPLGGRVLVRLPKAGEHASIRERTSEIETQYINEFRQKKSVFRLSGTKVETAKAAIVNWEKFYNEEDKELPCTPVNIEIMCLEDGFLDFIDQCLAVLEKERSGKQEDEEKN